MRIEDLKVLPKMHRVIEVDLDVLRIGFGHNYGAFEFDDVAKRKVRRVLHDRGWKWQLVRECKNQEQWDYCFESDKECVNEINHELGLV